MNGSFQYPDEVIQILRMPSPRQLPESQRTGLYPRTVRAGLILLGCVIAFFFATAYFAAGFPAAQKLFVLCSGAIVVLLLVLLLILLWLKLGNTPVRYFTHGQAMWGKILSAELIPVGFSHGEPITWKYRCDVEIEEQPDKKKIIEVCSALTDKAGLAKYDPGLTVGEDRLILALESKARATYRFYHLLGLDERLTKLNADWPETKKAQRKFLFVLLAAHTILIILSFYALNWQHHMPDPRKAYPMTVAVSLFIAPVWLWFLNKKFPGDSSKLSQRQRLSRRFHGTIMFVGEVLLVISAVYGFLFFAQRNILAAQSVAISGKVDHLVYEGGMPRKVSVLNEQDGRIFEVTYSLFLDPKPEIDSKVIIEQKQGVLPFEWVEKGGAKVIER